MSTKQVNFTGGTVYIHPYVQGRLRALPRQDESAGILLGTSENSVINVTGFKRVTPRFLRQTAADAGPALVGFYRLQTPSAPTLLPEEEEMWRDAQPDGRGLFLLVRATEGGVEGTAWTREDGGLPTAEKVSLDGERMERNENGFMALPPTFMTGSRVARPALLIALFGIVAGAVAFQFWPASKPPELSLDLVSRDGELAAVWVQQGAPKEPLQLASLSILDGSKEQTVDLTGRFTPKGRISVRPHSSDVILTLRVKYAGMALVSRSATYLGFVPAPAAPAVAPEPVKEAAFVPDPAIALMNAELDALRKRNKELEEAVAALRKHVLP